MIDKVRQVTGIRINCTAPNNVEFLIKDIRSVTNKPNYCLSNLGGPPDGEKLQNTGQADNKALLTMLMYGRPGLI